MKKAFYCEICGRPIYDKVYVIEVENAILRVCKDCAKLGKVLRVVSLEEASQIDVEKEKERKYEVVYEFVPNYNELIRKYREQMGLTQRELAQKLGVKESIIKKIESGEAYPDEKLTRKLEKLFGIKLMEKKRIAISTESKKEEVEVTLGDLVEIEEE